MKQTHKDRLAGALRQINLGRDVLEEVKDEMVDDDESGDDEEASDADDALSSLEAAIADLEQLLK